MESISASALHHSPPIVPARPCVNFQLFDGVTEFARNSSSHLPTVRYVRSRALTVLSPHSQMTIRFQPSFAHSFSCRRSRATFALNFARQNAVLVFGVVALLHPSCRCQKQPRISISVLIFGIAMSGCPGTRSYWQRNRQPFAYSHFLTTSSGIVSVLCTDLIILDRSSLLTLSIEHILFWKPHYFCERRCPLVDASLPTRNNLDTGHFRRFVICAHYNFLPHHRNLHSSHTRERQAHSNRYSLPPYPSAY